VSRTWFPRTPTFHLVWSYLRSVREFVRLLVPRCRPGALVGDKDYSQELMQIRYYCPTDACVAIVEYEPFEECGETIECPRCRRTHPMIVTKAMREQKIVDRCAVCGAMEMYTRKDFPQRLGLLIVVVFGFLAIYYFSISVVKAWLVMATAMLIDLVIYYLVGKVTTCYACRAEYRKCRLNPAHEEFDLAASEKY